MGSKNPEVDPAIAEERRWAASENPNGWYHLCSDDSCGRAQPVSHGQCCYFCGLFMQEVQIKQEVTE